MIPDICCGVMLEPQNQFFALIDCGPGFDKCVDLIFFTGILLEFFYKTEWS